MVLQYSAGVSERQQQSRSPIYDRDSETGVRRILILLCINRHLNNKKTTISVWLGCINLLRR